MDEGYYMALAKVRMDRAEELLIEAKDLFCLLYTSPSPRDS